MLMHPEFLLQVFQLEMILSPALQDQLLYYLVQMWRGLREEISI